MTKNKLNIKKSFKNLFLAVFVFIVAFFASCGEDVVIPPIKNNILFQKDSIVIRNLMPPDTFLSLNYYCYEPNVGKIKLECSFATNIDSQYIYGITSGSETISDTPSILPLTIFDRTMRIFNIHTYIDTINIPDSLLAWKFKATIAVHTIRQPSIKYIKAYNIKITKLE